MNEATLNVSLLQEKQEAKERLQEMLLASLSKTDFFSKAAFYGGTAARIFYDLPRFSEDLDFSLLQKNPSFTFEPYFPTIQRVCQKLGVDVELSEKKKTQTTSTKSAFLKANTYRVLSFYFPSSEKALVHPDEAIRIKFETDDDPPLGGATEFRMLSSPFPSFVRVYSLPSLFAGKLSALLCREYGNRVKGRDYFDYLYYIGKGVSVDLPFLSSRLIHSGKLQEGETLSKEKLLSMLQEEFRKTNYELAVQDVSPFLSSDDRGTLEHWNAETFLATLGSLKAAE